MDYCITYSNFEEFKEAHPTLAEELLNEISEGEWQNDILYYYETLSDLAKYELEEGWYAACGLGDINVNGAPNIIDYIDLTALGEALSDSWDESCYHRFSDDSVISTNYGW